MAAQAMAPGITDDGSGTAAVMELARVMSQYQFDKTIVFIAFAAEEIRVSGSQIYAATAKQTGMQIEAVLKTTSSAAMWPGTDALQRMSCVCSRPARETPRAGNWGVI